MKNYSKKYENVLRKLQNKAKMLKIIEKKY